MLRSAFLRAETLLTKHFIAFSFLSYVFGLSQYVAILSRGQRSYPHDWKLTSFFVSYADFGFLKRALIGTFTKPVLGMLEPSSTALELAVVAIDLAIFGALLVCLSRVFQRIDPNDGPLVKTLKLLVILSPVGFVQMGYDSGRLDHFNLLLMAAAFGFIASGRYVLAALALAIGLLIHEAIVFFALPLICAIALHGRRTLVAPASEMIRGLVALVPVGIALALLVAKGNAPAHVEALLPPELSLGAYPWSRAVLEPQLNMLPVEYATIAFYTIVPYLLLEGYYRANRLPRDLLYWAAFAPLALFLLGVDYARWTHLVFVGVSTTILLQAIKPGLSRFDVRAVPLRPALYLFAAPLGPIGVEKILPYLTSLGNALKLF